MSGDTTSRLRKNPSDRELWSEWYSKIFPQVVYKSYYGAYGRAYSAQDAAQDAFIKFVDSEAIHNVRSDEEAILYLRILIKNTVSNEIRKETRRSALLDRYSEDLFQTKEETSSPEDQVAFRQELDRILAELNEVDQEIFVSGLRGDSLQEIADKTGLSYTNAGARRHRLLRKLQRERKPVEE